MPSYHNDVFWFYAHTSFEHGQDGVHCLDGLCRHRVVPTQSENEVKIKSQFISVTEYLTPDTPDLLDIRLAWQSLGYNDQAFEFISLIDNFLIFVTHEKRSKVFSGQGDYELEAQVGSTSCSVSPNRCQSSIIINVAIFQVIHPGGRSSLDYQLSARRDRRILWRELATSMHGRWTAKPRGE